MTERLLQGLRAFNDQQFPQLREHFEGLAAGQSPQTLFITCSDSRIDPSLITQTRPGELFVIRNAGNLIPPHGESHVGGDAATVEYAVVALGVEHIVVCGHTHCGAMAGLMAPESLASLPGVASWLRHALPVRDSVEAAEPGTDSADPVRANVEAQLANLRTYPFVAKAEAEGRLHLHGWVYGFETGDVLALGSNGFSSLLETSGHA